MLTSKLILDEIVGKQFLQPREWEEYDDCSVQDMLTNKLKSYYEDYKEDEEEYESDAVWVNYESLAKEFCNPDKWKRVTKERVESLKRNNINTNITEQEYREEVVNADLSYEIEQYATNKEKVLLLHLSDSPDFGHKDVDLIMEAVNLYRETGKRPWKRVFIPQNEDLSDKFRLEVCTDFDDTKILFWIVSED